MPDEIENYVHRIGRTGRCGKTGVATTFINKARRSERGDTVSTPFVAYSKRQAVQRLSQAAVFRLLIFVCLFCCSPVPPAKCVGKKCFVRLCANIYIYIFVFGCLSFCLVFVFCQTWFFVNPCFKGAVPERFVVDRVALFLREQDGIFRCY